MIRGVHFLCFPLMTEQRFKRRWVVTREGISVGFRRWVYMLIWH